MATPKLYARYSAAARSVWAKHRWKAFATLVVISFTPAILERGFAFGPSPGRALFVFMFLYFAALVPLIAFPKELPARPWSLGVFSWAWARAMACTIWAGVCVWIIFRAFSGVQPV
jgi:uncharacterized oligopeptide transporter (OPT) family protein